MEEVRENGLGGVWSIFVRRMSRLRCREGGSGGGGERRKRRGEERRGASEVDMRKRQGRSGNIIMSPVAVRILYGKGLE